MRSKRGLAFPPLALALLVLSAGFAPVAEAKRGPCIVGQKKPTCRVWIAKTMATADGDTVNVRIRKGRRWSKRTDVRLLGVQAMELTDYSRVRGRKGECHAVEAAERLEFLLQGRRVKRRMIRLSALKASSVTQGARKRLRRWVAYRAGGRWHDVGRVLISEGHALWDPNGKEWASNRLYSTLAWEAAATGRNLWDTDYCGSGPHEGSPLELKVKWDGEGRDGRNVNGEWVRIKNNDPVNDVSLRGWWLRDAFLRRYEFQRRYHFPRGAVVPAGGSIRVHVGRGGDSANAYHWGEAAPVFENVKGGKRAIGDGAYLFDSQGDLRAWQMYPCRVDCRDPLKGRVEVRARRRAPESVRITNVSSRPADLTEYDLESVPWFYEFPPGTVLAPGQRLVVHIQRNPRRDLPFEFGWGFRKYLLGDRRDVVTLRNPLGAPVACHAWGRGKRCPRV